MRSLFPSSYDRADVLMSSGCSTFVSAALILVVPHFGILLLEILVGLFLIGCAPIARRRIRRRALGAHGAATSKNAKARWFDKYDVFMIGVVIVIQTCAGGLLRKTGLSEGTVDTLPLILFAGGILMKPRAMEFLEGRKKTNQGVRIRTDPAVQSVGAVDDSEALRQTVMGSAKDGDLE